MNLSRRRLRRALVSLIVLAGCGVPATRVETIAPATTTTSTTSTTAAPTTTTAPPTTTSTSAAPAPAAVSSRSLSRPVVVEGDEWPEQLAACESTGDTDGRAPHTIDLTATSKTGKYLGAGQFSRSTHLSAGGDGDPRDESWAQQRATIVSWRYAGNGRSWPRSQWPTCWPLLFGP